MTDLDLLTTPGHDRDVAYAVLSQSRLCTSPIDDIQVRHLLAIGYRAGRAASIAATLPLLFDPKLMVRCLCGQPTAVTRRDTGGGQHGGDVLGDGEHGTAVIERRCTACNLQATITVDV